MRSLGELREPVMHDSVDAAHSDLGDARPQ